MKGVVILCLATMLQANAEHGSNLAEVLTKRGFSTLVDLVVKAGLADTVANGGPFTVFAPTNDAFAALDPALVASLVSRPEELSKVLLYHVVPGAVRSSDLRDNLSVDSVQGAPLTINVNRYGIRVNGVSVVQADIHAKNGVVHVIDQVLLPPADAPAAPGNLAEVLTAQGFTTLVDLVVKAGLADTVANGGPFTVFAPTNEAFAALDPALVASLVSRPEELSKVLLYHVVPGAVRSSDLRDNLSVNSANGTPLLINLPCVGATVNGVLITRVDVPASNGVVHVVDKVLLPPTHNIVDLLAADGRFTTLVKAVVTAGLDTTLAGAGPFTVFAPTDDAFARLPAGTVTRLLRDRAGLTKVLLRHVLPKTLYANVLCHETYTTVGGEQISTTISYGAVVVKSRSGTATVVVPDIGATNGVIHAIDNVL